MTIIFEFPIDLTSGLEMRIAHRKSAEGREPMSFPNQRLPVYVEATAYIRGNELVSARLASFRRVWDGFSVELKLRRSAVDKMNALAARSELPKLGVFKRGAPVMLIQAVYAIPADVLVWTGFPTEQKAREMLDSLFGLEPGSVHP